VVESVVAGTRMDRRLLLFLNISALHQPNRHYLPGATEDSKESHAAALEYVDRHIDRLFRAFDGRPCFVILCSDHGTAYGEDGHSGHRVAHEAVWTVPYAEFVLAAQR
jgi:arylsulfatase A-like enzyme